MARNFNLLYLVLLNLLVQIFLALLDITDFWALLGFTGIYWDQS